MWNSRGRCRCWWKCEYETMIIKKDIAKLADIVVGQAAMFNCSFEEAWDKYTHPTLTEQVDFKEVLEYINDKIELGKGVNGQ